MTAAEVCDRAGLELVGRCTGGEIQAHEVRLADGRRAVMKWYEGRPEIRGDLEWMVAAVAALRARGAPVPAYEPVVEVDGALVVVQEWVDGALSDDVSAELVDQVVAVNGLQAGLGAAGDRRWGEFLAQSLTDARPSSSWLPPVAVPSVEDVPGDDAMHMDLHHRNVLQVDGLVGAVIDWETCRPGDRRLDLVVFGVCLAVATVPAEAEERLWEHIRSVTPGELVDAYVRYIGLRLVDWALSADTPWTPGFWAEAAARRLR